MTRRHRHLRLSPRRGLSWLSALLILFISSQYAVAGPLMLQQSGAMDALKCVKHQQGFLTAPTQHDHDEHAPTTRHNHSDCLLCFAPPVVDGSPEVVSITRTATVQAASLNALEPLHVQAEHHGFISSRAPPSE